MLMVILTEPLVNGQMQWNIEQQYVQNWNPMKCSYNNGSRGTLTVMCRDGIRDSFKSAQFTFDKFAETVQCMKCNLEIIVNNTFEVDNEIKTLDLTCSGIFQLQPGAFTGLVFLRKLILNSNLISEVPATTFQGISKVDQLICNNNKINSLVPSGFKELVNLKVLSLRNNKIDYIDRTAFDGLTSLESLDLSNNQIENIFDIFSSLNSLLSINLENNKISDINISDPSALATLIELNLANNYFMILRRNKFLNLKSLKVLNISYNPIGALEVGAFRGLYSLENILLHNCVISDIQNEVFKTLHSLQILDISYNNISSFKIELYLGLSELQQLNLSHNLIGYLEKNGDIRLQRLNTLDLSYNTITDIDYKELVEQLPRLSHLRLEGNLFPLYLAKEMNEYFKEDGLVFSIGQTFENPNLCNDSRKYKAIFDAKKIETAEETLKQASNTYHEVIQYFICFTLLASVICLFYLQYRNQRNFKGTIVREQCPKVHLISSNEFQAEDNV